MEEFRNTLTVWYNHHKRKLPWRDTKDPYRIWVSEIILQQTRVQQGIVYYHNFLHAFPELISLALSSEAEVLKVWQGLGYYSRARNMHFAARTILSAHGGKFPDNYSSLRKLKGIGDYTAAAIASIAFNLPYAVVDGNVYRVLSRLFGIQTPIDTLEGKKEYYQLAQLLLDKRFPGDFNQALMEFGATQCLPNQPLCNDCPMAMKCYAQVNRSVANFPVKSKQTKLRERYLNYFFVHGSDKIILEMRSKNDIWKNLYQFPLIETDHPATDGEILDNSHWRSLLPLSELTLEAVSTIKIHLLTHQRLFIRFFTVRMQDLLVPDHLILVNQSDLYKYPVPKPIEQFLQEVIP